MNNYLIIPELNKLKEYLELAKKHNLGFEFNDFFLPKVLSDEAKVNEIADSYLRHDMPEFLTLHGDFFDVLVFSADEEIREVSRKRIYQSMEAAKLMGAKKVIFHTNVNSAIPTEVYYKNWLECNETVFKGVCADYPDVTVLMENMFDYDSSSLLELSKRMEGVSNFGVCLDYAHAYLSKEDVNSWCEKLSPYIKHVHINDNDGIKDLHLAVGSGKIDWRGFEENRAKYFPEASILIEVNGIEKIKDSLEFLNI